MEKESFQKKLKQPVSFSLKGFEGVLEKMKDVFVRKNHDYGNSFDSSLDEFGDVAAMVRINDKINRLKNLLTNYKALVEDETLDDTILDAANYLVMWLSYRVRHSEITQIGDGISTSYYDENSSSTSSFADNSVKWKKLRHENNSSNDEQQTIL